MAHQILTPLVELSDSCLEELMSHCGRASESEFVASHIPVLLDEALQGLLLKERIDAC